MATVGQVLAKRLGRLVANRNPTPPPRPFGEMGTGGTAVWGGYVQVKERSPEWIGRQKYVTSSELAVNTSIVAAGVHYFLNLVAYPNWTFRATDEDDEESLALAEFAENVVNDMDTPWYKVVRRAAMYRFHGFGLQEWTAKHRDDGLIGFKDIEARPQQTIEQWDVDDNGVVLGVWQRSPQTGAMLGIPRDKLLYLVEDTLTDNPEGIGMFRHMADPYMRLKQMQQLEIRAFERDLRGTPIARAPLTMLDRAVSQGVITEAEARALIADFESLVKLQVKQSDTGIIMDSLPYFSDSDAGDQVSGLPQWSFELLSGAGVGHAEIAAAIDRLQREIARIIGVEHLMMGDVGGNRSLAEDKSRNLYLIANSVLKYIAAKVKSDILVPLWRLNGFPLKKLPEIKPEDVTFKNVDAITNAIGKMSSAGAVLAPNDPVINDVRDLLGVTRVPDDMMAAGASNPMLAGLPPQLQMPGMGPKGGPPGLGGGGPGKQPGFGGGAAPGQGGGDPTKPFGKRPHILEEDTEDGDVQAADPGGKHPADTSVNVAGESSPRIANPAAAAAKPERPPAEEAPAPEAAARPGGQETRQGSDLTQLDLNGAKPGGNVEVPTALLVRLLERLSSEQAPMAGAAYTPAGDPKPAGHPTADKPKPSAVADPKAEGPKAEQSPAGPQLQSGREDTSNVEVAEGLAGERAAADGSKAPPAEAGGSGPEPESKPSGGDALERPGHEVRNGGDLPKTGPGLGAGGSKPAGGERAPAPDALAGAKPGQPQPGPAGTGTGEPADAGGGPASKPGSGAPAEANPMGTPPGMPPGMGAPPAAPEPEMTPERASEILQPYADPSITPEEDNPKTESDILWTRLGDEKDVGPITDLSSDEAVTRARLRRGIAADEKSGTPAVEDGGVSADAGNGSNEVGAGFDPVESKAPEDAVAGEDLKPKPRRIKQEPKPKAMPTRRRRIRL